MFIGFNIGVWHVRYCWLRRNGRAASFGQCYTDSLSGPDSFEFECSLSALTDAQKLAIVIIVAVSVGACFFFCCGFAFCTGRFCFGYRRNTASRYAALDIQEDAADAAFCIGLACCLASANARS